MHILYLWSVPHPRTHKRQKRQPKKTFGVDDVNWKTGAYRALLCICWILFNHHQAMFAYNLLISAYNSKKYSVRTMSLYNFTNAKKKHLYVKLFSCTVAVHSIFRSLPLFTLCCTIYSYAITLNFSSKMNPSKMAQIQFIKTHFNAFNAFFFFFSNKNASAFSLLTVCAAVIILLMP